jgi:hypothetical protein
MVVFEQKSRIVTYIWCFMLQINTAHSAHHIMPSQGYGNFGNYQSFEKKMMARWLPILQQFNLH